MTMMTMEQPLHASSTSVMNKDGKLVLGDLSMVQEDDDDDPLFDESYDSGNDDDDDHEGSGGHRRSSARKAQEEEERKSLMNRKEEKGVQLLRIVVYTVVIVTAVLVSVGVYFYARDQEQTNFQQVFETNANKLAQAFLDSVDRKITAVGGLSTMITNYALTHDLTFPNVTVEGWESVSVQTRIQADGMVVEWFPLVTDETRLGWEEYAFTHKDWRPRAHAKEQQYKEEQDSYFGLETRVVNMVGPGTPPGQGPRPQGEGPPPSGTQTPPSGGQPGQGDLPPGSPQGQSIPTSNTQQGEGPPPSGAQLGQVIPPSSGQQGQSPLQGGQGPLPSDGQQAQDPPPSGVPSPPPDNSRTLQEQPPQQQQQQQQQQQPQGGGEFVPAQAANGPLPPQSGEGTQPPPNSVTPGNGGPQWPGGAMKGPPYMREIFSPVFTPGQPLPKHVVRPYGSGPYAPRWQMSPTVPHEFLMNADLLAIPSAKVVFSAVLNSSKAALSPGLAVRDPNNITADDLKLVNINRDFLVRGQYRHDRNYYNGDPTTFLVYPVFDKFGAHNRTMAGWVQMPLLWRLNLEKVLPEGMNGFIGILTNNFDQHFTYRIDGPTVTYLGMQDLHDNKYDDMYVFQNMAETIQANRGPDTQTFDAVELDTEFGRYYFYIYPSQLFEDEYITNEPAIFAATVASIFLFTVLVLMAFDFLVTRRQSIMMKKAVESTALVSTLYPKQVRERLFEDEEDDSSNKNRKKWKTSISTGSSTATTMGTTTIESRAIAERYPASSVLLMDLAGFTKWSSSREPEAVFVLLESLYQSFDRIASKRGVYKIETIGDCWVGVTGVPDAQDDHAPRMAKFAATCQVKMGQLIAHVLTDKLGTDTAELALRVGIDSGPITGGILRGDRGRFQLFGDTINTASRMESNGVPGKIHVSQGFADEMIRHGYQSWLVEREDKIHAKGKGLMTTYWVNVSTMRSTTTRSTTEGAYTDSEDASDVFGGLNSSSHRTSSGKSSWNHPQLQSSNTLQSSHRHHQQQQQPDIGSSRKQASNRLDGSSRHDDIGTNDAGSNEVATQKQWLSQVHSQVDV